METPTYNREKFTQLYLYFACKSKEDPNFDTVKHNKLLFRSDFLAFGHFGKPITGATYIHLPKGPAPAHTQRYGVQDELIKKGVLLSEKFDFAGKTLRKVKYLPATAPETNLLSKEELELADDSLRALKDYNSDEVSAVSHNWLGWKMTRNNQVIPYQTVYIRYLKPVTLDDMDWAKKILVARGIQPTSWQTA